MSQKAHVQRLFAIAMEARRHVENVAAARGFPADLHRFCAPAALYLFRQLRANGFAARFVVGNNHCFCKVGDLIVDITATQFRHADAVRGVWIVNAACADMIADPGVWAPRAVFDKEPAIFAAGYIWRNWPAGERPHALDAPAPHDGAPFDRRGHARMSHRYYMDTARRAEEPGDRAAALSAAAVWRRIFADTLTEARHDAAS